MEVNFSAEPGLPPEDEVFKRLWEDKYLPQLKTRFTELATEFRSELVARIVTDQLYLARNSAAYLKRKESKYGKGVTPPLVSSGEYINSIAVIPNEMGASVGVDKQVHTSGTKSIEMDKLITILEYGTDTIPPRPHWRVILAEFTKKYGTFTDILLNAYAEAEQEAAQVYADMVQQEIAKNMGI